MLERPRSPRVTSNGFCASTMDPEPAKLYLILPRIAVDLKKPLAKRCPNDVMVVDQIKAASYWLDLSPGSMKGSGTLYNKADDELAKFSAFRTAEFVRQICAIFIT